ncbi:MAG: hypothetical protein IKK21_06275 [Clostridia bacterium]|nr:hypothetical protein [Clostridia bacterium]
MNVNELLNVYFYALYDEGDQQAHSGLTANICEASVKTDIADNYTTPRYVTVHRVPGLVGVYDQATGMVTIVPRELRLQVGEKVECKTCYYYDKCTRKPTTGQTYCEDWGRRE